MHNILKRKYKILFISFVFFLLFSINFAFAQVAVDEEKILSFNGEIRVNTDSTINVKEVIAYDFGEGQRHGIFRFIPIKYKARGGNFNLRLSGIKVTDESGAPYNFEISYPENNVEIKIGDANKLVSGKKIYAISYTVRRAVNYFSDYDELYWNFTGDKWEAPIESASVNVILPGIAKDNLQYKCFEGVYGGTNECEAGASENTIKYISKGTLVPGQGLTIVAGWPKRITPEPTFWQKISDIVRDNWTLFFPPIIFVLMFWLWHAKGRDPKGRGTIIAQYEPPDGMKPAEMGTLLDGSADAKDISSTIIDLAVRGYLKIKRIEEKGWLGKKVDYEFIRLKSEEPPNNFEETVMDGIFSGGVAKEKKLKDLQNHFYKYLKIAQEQLYKKVTEKGYYVSNPQITRITWVVIAVFAGVALTFLFGSLQGAFGALSGITSGIIMVVFSWLMPRTTKTGAETKENILGFKNFLSVTETDRLKFHNAPEKNPEMFEKYLPYAMVLGVEKEWAKQFEGIYNQQPNWYEDSSGRAFNAIILSSVVNDFSSSAMTTMASQPSSAAGGGSGFSGGGAGGGGGGGGGGSW